MSDHKEKDGIGIELGELTSPDLQTSEKPLDTGNQNSESLLCATLYLGRILDIKRGTGFSDIDAHI